MDGTPAMDAALFFSRIQVVSGASDMMVFLRSHGRVILLVGSLVLAAADGFGGEPGPPGNVSKLIPDVLQEDTDRARALLSSRVPERRIEGIQELSNLRDWAAEEAVLRLLDDPSLAVRRETLLALGRLGTRRSIPALIRMLDDPAWELRQNAWLELCQMTAQRLPPTPRRAWEAWWGDEDGAIIEASLFSALRAGSNAPPRRESLRALRHLATPASESNLLQWASLPLQPSLTAEEGAFIADTLDRIGTARSLPLLVAMSGDAANWPLGRLGGPQAEQSLLQRPKTLAVLLNLDRLQSTRCGPSIPELVGSMGLVTYRGQPDDLMNLAAQPIQRVAAHLILRSGQADLLVEGILCELEATLQPPLSRPTLPALPTSWQPMFQQMRVELKPGFVRGDGLTTSQPLTALSFIATNQALTPRLIRLLRHPAFVARVYVATTLGRQQTTAAVPEMLRIIQEGYPFSDATALASGKHFDQSQTVRWRGFLCMALGRVGGEEARAALEQLAAAPGRPRDIRYSAVVGLEFLASPQSLGVLRNVATNDLIWMVRDEARRAAQNIEILSQEAQR